MALLLEEGEEALAELGRRAHALDSRDGPAYGLSGQDERADWHSHFPVRRDIGLDRTPEAAATGGAGARGPSRCCERRSRSRGVRGWHTGDAFFVAFVRVCRSCRRRRAQRALGAAWPDGGEVRVHIGVHTGGRSSPETATSDWMSPRRRVGPRTSGSRLFPVDDRPASRRGCHRSRSASPEDLGEPVHLAQWYEGLRRLPSARTFRAARQHAAPADALVGAARVTRWPHAARDRTLVRSPARAASGRRDSRCRPRPTSSRSSGTGRSSTASRRSTTRAHRAEIDVCSESTSAAARPPRAFSPASRSCSVDNLERRRGGGHLTERLRRRWPAGDGRSREPLRVPPSMSTPFRRSRWRRRWRCSSIDHAPRIRVSSCHPVAQVCERFGELRLRRAGRARAAGLARGDPGSVEDGEVVLTGATSTSSSDASALRHDRVELPPARRARAGALHRPRRLRPWLHTRGGGCGCRGGAGRHLLTRGQEPGPPRRFPVRAAADAPRVRARAAGGRQRARAPCGVLPRHGGRGLRPAAPRRGQRPPRGGHRQPARRARLVPGSRPRAVSPARRRARLVLDQALLPRRGPPSSRVGAGARRVTRRAASPGTVAEGSIRAIQGDRLGFERLDESIAIFRSLGDDTGAAAAFDELGWAYFWHGDNDASGAAFAESLALRRGLADERAINRALVGVAQVLVAVGHVEEAETLSRELLERTADGGDGFAEHLAYHFLGDARSSGRGRGGRAGR